MATKYIPETNVHITVKLSDIEVADANKLTNDEIIKIQRELRQCKDLVDILKSENLQYKDKVSALAMMYCRSVGL